MTSDEHQQDRLEDTKNIVWKCKRILIKTHPVHDLAHENKMAVQAS